MYEEYKSNQIIQHGAFHFEYISTLLYIIWAESESLLIMFAN